MPATDPFLGEISIVSFNFAPVGWAFCNGQLLPINQNTALFSLIGTIYGGNGVTTFALPNLQGRLPMHFGTGTGLSPRDQGEQGGTEAVALTTSQMPAHSHPLLANDNTTNIAAGGSNSYLNSKTESGESIVATGLAAGVTLNGASLSAVGGSQAHLNMPPFLVLNFIICLQGVYPSRN
ncbi:MAG: tail fiber protein [Chitinophagaceae bacterium]